MIVVGVVLLVIIVLFIFACCRVASMADDWKEEK